MLSSKSLIRRRRGKRKEVNKKIQNDWFQTSVVATNTRVIISCDSWRRWQVVRKLTPDTMIIPKAVNTKRLAMTTTRMRHCLILMTLKLEDPQRASSSSLGRWSSRTWSSITPTWRIVTCSSRVVVRHRRSRCPHSHKTRASKMVACRLTRTRKMTPSLSPSKGSLRSLQSRWISTPTSRRSFRKLSLTQRQSEEASKRPTSCVRQSSFSSLIQKTRRPRRQGSARAKLPRYPELVRNKCAWRSRLWTKDALKQHSQRSRILKYLQPRIRLWLKWSQLHRTMIVRGTTKSSSS